MSESVTVQSKGAFKYEMTSSKIKHIIKTSLETEKKPKLYKI